MTNLKKSFTALLMLLSISNAFAAEKKTIDFASPVKLWGYGLIAVGGAGYITGKTSNGDGLGDFSAVTVSQVGGVLLAGAGAVMILGDVLGETVSSSSSEALAADFEGSEKILKMAMDKGQIPFDENLINYASVYSCLSCKTDFEIYEKMNKDFQLISSYAESVDMSRVHDKKYQEQMVSDLVDLVGEDNIGISTLALAAKLAPSLN